MLKAFPKEYSKIGISVTNLCTQKTIFLTGPVFKRRSCSLLFYMTKIKIKQRILATNSISNKGD